MCNASGRHFAVDYISSSALEYCFRLTRMLFVNIYAWLTIIPKHFKIDVTKSSIIALVLWLNVYVFNKQIHMHQTRTVLFASYRKCVKQ